MLVLIASPQTKKPHLSAAFFMGDRPPDPSPSTTRKVSALDGINIEESEEFKVTKYFCKTNFDMEKIKLEESFHVDLPRVYAFASEIEKEIMLNRNFKRINEEVSQVVKELARAVGCWKGIMLFFCRGDCKQQYPIVLRKSL